VYPQRATIKAAIRAAGEPPPPSDNHHADGLTLEANQSVVGGGALGLRGGGGVTVNGKKVNYGRFLKRWQIDKLFYKHRMKESKRIVEKEIRKVL